jgi:cation diffusion facilitator CzcD-associated flavoprotein CzcO
MSNRPGDGYLEALIRDNVDCEFDDIARVTPTGIETVTGKNIELDVLACATGFYVQYQPHFKIIGTGGQVMQDNREPNVYASVAAPGFPNYFVINGPRYARFCVESMHMLTETGATGAKAVLFRAMRHRWSTSFNAVERCRRIESSVWSQNRM